MDAHQTSNILGVFMAEGVGFEPPRVGRRDSCEPVSREALEGSESQLPPPGDEVPRIAREPYRFFLKFRRALAAPFTTWWELTLPRTPLALVGSNPFPKPKRRTDPSGRYAVLAEGVGFEPTRAVKPSGFQDRPDSQVPCTPPRPL